MQRQSVLQSRLVSRLVVWGWGSCSAGCPAGARLRAPRVRISQPAQSLSSLSCGAIVALLWCATVTLRHSAHRNIIERIEYLQREGLGAGYWYPG